MKVSDHIAKFLADQEIRHVFGIVGAGNAQVFDAISRLGYTEIVCVHHEQAAVMAATTYFRTTGKVTFVLLTTGAGSSNGITGVVSAWMDSMPVVIISGNENSKYTTDKNPLRIWGVQGYDSTCMVEKVTKLSDRLMDSNNILNLLTKAYNTAQTSRPGPVWIDIPMNLQGSIALLDSLNPVEIYKHELIHKNENHHFFDCNSGSLKLINLLKSSKRPVLWLGNGIKFAGAEGRVEDLVESIGAPTLVSWQACDILDSDHELCFGRAGVYGQRASNFVLQNSDLLICIGTRLAIPQIGYDQSEFARDAKLVMVDIDPNEILKLESRVNVPVLSDAGDFIDTLLSLTRTPYNFNEWNLRCKEYQKKYPTVGPEHEDVIDNSGVSFINSYKFMQILETYFTDNQIVVTDMGTALLSGHQVLKFKHGQKMMTSTGLGEMGFGLPGAIGAAIGSEKEIICLNCDGGMMMNLQELQTIAHHKLPIKIIIFNNDGYLMIKHTQKALFEGRYSGSDNKSGVSCPDFSKIAHAFNFPSFKIKTWDDAFKYLPEVQSTKGPVICEVFTHPEQLFVPKLSVVVKEGGELVSPPLEDLSPLISREELRANMLIGIHEKSKQL